MNNSYIPKVVHYCWFGNKKKPRKVEKCIDSWKKHLPEYQLIEWNEQNFDVYQNSYIKEAYNAKKFAFVSDIARINALQKYGGIYMDTDVEVLRKFDDLLINQCVLGFEEKNFVATSFIAISKNHSLLEEFFLLYQNEKFLKSDGNYNMKTNVERLTNLLLDKGLEMNGKHQTLVDDIKIYPKEYFSPYDYINCTYDITDKSYCIHHFYVTWHPWTTHLKKYIKSIIVKIIGRKNMNLIRNKFHSVRK